MKINFSEERLKEKVTALEIAQVTKGDLFAIISIISKFAFEDGEYLDPGEALVIIANLSLGEFEEINKQFNDQFEISGIIAHLKVNMEDTTNNAQK